MYNLCISEEKDRVFSVQSGRVIKLFQVFAKGGVIISSREFNLETFVSCHVSSQSEGKKSHHILTTPGHGFRL